MKISSRFLITIVGALALPTKTHCFLRQQHVASITRKYFIGQPNNHFVLQPRFSSTSSLKSEQSDDDQQKIVTTCKKWCKDTATAISSTTAAILVAITILATPWEIQVSTREAPTSPTTTSDSSSSSLIQMQKSKALALTEEQLLVTDVWKEVTQQYIDKTYNGMGEDKWKQKRLEAVKKVTNVGPDEEEKVYEIIRSMLSNLNDPYTRFLTPEQYDAIANVARGDSAGVGISLQVDPKSGQVMVLNTSPNSPAEKGGIVPGDVIVEVDGIDMTKAPAEVVAAKCRGPAGTNVNIAVRHPTGSGKITPLTLERANIQVNPVKTGTTTVKNKKFGVIQLTSFSQETTKQVVEALRQLQQQEKVDAIVLDVRGNAGGYMPAGVDVAKLFLPPKTRIITQVDKNDRQTIEIADGIGSETELPLYIVVDKRTASASEIMTAGLQDNNRAVVLGNSKTFGKGRIQNVQAMSDGSGISVTKAKYMTPKGLDIHGIGITPNIKSDTCGPENTVSDCLSSVL